MNDSLQLKSCKFCSIVTEKNQRVLYENEKLFIIEDIKSGKSAYRHILVCPKEHIESVQNLNKLEHLQLLDQMQNFGQQFLVEQNPNNNYKFGYHQPPYISVRHLHLHGLVLPIYNCFWELLKYGCFLSSTEKIKGQVRQRIKKLNKENILND